MGANSQQAHYVVMTSHRRHFHVMCPLDFSINQCPTITFLILKSDIIENSRIELRGIVLPVPSNQIKVAFIIILLFNLYIYDFFLFHIEIEGKGRWIIGGAKGYVAPHPSQIIGGGAAPPGPTLPTPMNCCIVPNITMPLLT